MIMKYDPYPTFNEWNYKKQFSLNIKRWW